ESLHKISMASNLLLTLVNDVLDISKVESGKMSLNPTVFSFCDFINNIVGIEYPLVKEKNLDFEVRLIDIQKAFLYADSLRLNQIFINILSNAVKYTEPGGEVTVDIKQAVCPNDENKIRLIYTVSDNGIGMSEDFMKQMFLPFSRATDTRISVIQGSGLGLAITKQMIDFMGGNITVESELGKGSKFEVSIDLEYSNKELIFDYSLEGIKVLFLDDDELILDSTKKVLDFFKVKSDCISDAKVAEKLILEKFGTKEAYDVIIVDQSVKRLSVIDFVKSLNEKIHGNLPHVLIATFDWSEIEKKALAAGIEGYISKPLFKCCLYRRLNECLSNQDFSCRVEENNDDVKGLNVLIAEDNDLNWEIIHEMLGFYDISSDRVVNGEECVDVINHVENDKYDLIFMDIQMPKMNGLDATRKIRKSSSDYAKNIPIIAMTADAFSENVTECIEAGMNGHIAKPVDMKLVLKEIRKALFGVIH
ncbi:MAG: response regulator, partial [Treponema sp.]|nr:response regulator [Treponema sp.]